MMLNLFYMEKLMGRHLNKNLRQEKKYTFTRGQLNNVEHKLISSGFKLNHAHNYVHNIYFDNYLTSGASESVEGDAIRKKYRLRWYNENNSFVLESKVRLSSSGYKNKKQIIIIRSSIYPGTFIKIREILNRTDHRPWAVPNESWKFSQEWNHSIFLHWQVELSELQKFVPKELEIDLFEGKPWVSVVAFTMEKIRPKNLPPFPPISNFDEINIRTYIKSNNKKNDQKLIDNILDKISKSGYESLTKNEKEILFKKRSVLLV